MQGFDRGCELTYNHLLDRSAGGLLAAPSPVSPKSDGLHKLQIVRRTKGGSREAHVSTQQSSPQEDARLSRADEHQEWPQGPFSPPPQGSQAPDCLTVAVVPAGDPLHPQHPKHPQHPDTRQNPQAPATPVTRIPPSTQASPSERFRRSQTLRKTSDFRRCYAEGRRKGGAFLVLHSLGNDQGAPRFGQTASRKVGGAVERHRLKRWAREIYRRWPERERLPPSDLIAHFKPGAAGADFAAFRGELERLLASLLPRVPSAAPAALDASAAPAAPAAPNHGGAK
jgi:ribonuclease P protein component